MLYDPKNEASIARNILEIEVPEPNPNLRNFTIVTEELQTVARFYDVDAESLEEAFEIVRTRQVRHYDQDYDPAHSEIIEIGEL
jgi:hypothetical protein